jgi:hypothetical protein
MSRFHDRTLALLGSGGELQGQPVPDLMAWAETNHIVLPAAYVEWAHLDRKNLLGKYSNGDRFDFEQPHIVTTPAGVQGLVFHRESQDNFCKIVALEQGDDPPVLFAWLGDPPWITHTERFSDCVYAQIFDWQYWLEADSSDPPNMEITYYGSIELRTDHYVGVLRDRFEETVTSYFLVYNKRFTEFRFLKSPKERMTVTVEDGGATNIRITGEHDLVRLLERELLEAFGDEVLGR